MSKSKDILTKTPVSDFSDLMPTVAEDNETALVTLEEQTATAIEAAIGEVLADLPEGWADDEPALQFATATQRYGYTEPSQPNTLPVPVSKALSLDGMNPIKWRTVGKLPAFIDPNIRKLGRMMLESFPCYRAFAEQCKQEGRDPQAEVRTISDFTNGMTDVQFAAKIIAEQGKMLEKGFADFGELIPHYNPDIGVFLTKSWTFKLVRDRVENGAPVDANYIYAWQGGADFYQHNQLTIQNRPALQKK